MLNNNFDFIRADGTREETLSDDRLHQKQTTGLQTGAISGQLRTLSPIHIGTGQLFRPSELHPEPQGAAHFKLIAPFFRQMRPDSDAPQRIIPGSSWRGVIRSIVELITYSGFPVANYGGRYGARVPNHLKASSYSARDQSRRRAPELDPATAIFGGMGYKTHARFDDVTTGNTDPWPIILIEQRWTPEVKYDDARKIYLHQEHLDEGTEALEACPPGIDWRFRISFMNLTDIQLGILLLALAYAENGTNTFFHKVGGGKGQGIGSAVVQNLDVRLRPAAEDSLLTYDNEWQKASADFLQQCIAAARKAENQFNKSAYDELVRMTGTIPDDLKIHLEDNDAD